MKKKIKADILDLIKTDHQAVEKLIGRLEKVALNPSSKTAEQLSTKLAFEFLLHAKSEEESLYTACEKYNVSFRDFVLEGHQEHELIEEMLMRLVESKPGKDGRFKAVLTVLKELIEHHAKEEEEKEMFPKIKRAFTPLEREEMALMMKAQKKILKPQIMFQRTAAEVAKIDVEEKPKPLTLADELQLH